MHIPFKSSNRVALSTEKKMSMCAIVKPVSIPSCLCSNDTVFHLAHIWSSPVCRFTAPWTEGLSLCILVSQEWLPTLLGLLTSWMTPCWFSISKSPLSFAQPSALFHKIS